MSIVRLVVTFFLSLSTLLTPYFQFMIHGGTDYLYDNWSETDEFTADYAFTVEKDPNKDFVILNFADVQLNDGDRFTEKEAYTEALIKKSIEEAKPDLITLTGDNASGVLMYLHMIEILDSYKIPWAPVMGNHDGSNGDKTTEAWVSYVLQQSEYCLYKPGPKGMGNGNYIINITENGKIVHTLFMMDTHSSSNDTEAGKINNGVKEDGSVASGYDHLWENQIKWYRWAVKGIEKLAGHTVESTAYMHIPVIEFRTVRDTMCDFTYDENGKKILAAPKSEYTDAFGAITEGGCAVCSPEGNNGFFATAVELGSTKNMVFGHDHVNNMSAVYEGIRLSFALKSGHGSYWSEDMMGASVVTVNSQGNASFSHLPYVEA